MKAIKYIAGVALLLALTTINIQVGSSTDSIEMLGLNIGLHTQTAEAMVQVDCEAELGGVCDTPWDYYVNECNPTDGNAQFYPCEN